MKHFVTTYNVLVIGAGKMGAFFDTPDSNNILTHAHAFYASPHFKLVGFLDCNRQVAQEAACIWGGQAFDSLVEAFSCGPIDVVTVAVPDDHHFTILKQLVDYPVKLVFVEKPLTKILSQTQEIIDLYKQRHIPLLVNYTRRFVPEFRALKNCMNQSFLGNYVSGTGYYGKGILHNGSHLIDFLIYLLGDIQHHQMVSFCADYYADDPSVSAVLFFENKRPFFLQAIDCRLYTIFEIDLFFTRARIRITDFGMYIQEYTVSEHAFFKDYINLNEENKRETLLYKSLLFATQNIYKHISQAEDLVCSAYDAYSAHLVCDDLLEKVRVV